MKENEINSPKIDIQSELKRKDFFFTLRNRMELAERN